MTVINIYTPSHPTVLFRQNILIKCYNKLTASTNNLKITYTFRGGNSVKIILSPFLKGIYSKRKEFAPKWSKFFPFRVDPFSEGTFFAGVTLVFFLGGNGKKHTKCIKYQ